MGVHITRRAGEAIQIDTGKGLITVTVIRQRDGRHISNRVCLDIDAPRHMPIWRAEQPPMKPLSFAPLGTCEEPADKLTEAVSNTRLSRGREAAQPTWPDVCTSNRQASRQVAHCDIPGCPECERLGLQELSTNRQGS